MPDMRDRLIELLAKYFDIGDSYAYNLTRVKTAFDVGTMTIDDFVEFDDEVVADIADHLLANGVILPPCKVGDKLFRIIKLTNGVYKPFVPTLPDTVEPYGIFHKGLMGEYRRIPFEDFGKTVFLTREEAEKALREEEK